MGKTRLDCPSTWFFNRMFGVCCVSYDLQLCGSQTYKQRLSAVFVPSVLSHEGHAPMGNDDMGMQKLPLMTWQHCCIISIKMWKLTYFCKYVYLEIREQEGRLVRAAPPEGEPRTLGKSPLEQGLENVLSGRFLSPYTGL